MNVNIFLETYSTEIIGGLIVSILLLVFNFASDFLKNFKIRKKYSGYIGEYYLYSPSATGMDIIICTTLSIQSILGKLTLKASEGVYKYKGTMDITERNLYIHIKGVEHLEQVNMVFHSPLHRTIKKLIGTQVAISPIDEPIANYCILSEEEITEEVIREYLSQLGKLQRSSVLKVEKTNTLYFDNIE